MNHKKSPTFRRITSSSKSITNVVAHPIFSAWLLCSAALLFGGVLQTKAQPAGSLDTTFGTGGKVSTLTKTGEINDLALQPDGKIIAGGYVYNTGTGNDFVVARYNSNGTVDASFGNAGIVALNFDAVASEDRVTAVTVQPDGKIVAVGYTYGFGSNYTGVSFAIVRFNSDGSLDTTFGTNGKIKANFGSGYNIDVGSSPPSLVLQPDGKFVVASARQVTASNYIEVTVSRYNANGTGDASFGNGGTAATRLFPSQVGVAAHSHRIALQSDGKIVLGGDFRYDQASGGSHSGGIFARYNTDGSLDNSFADGGLLIYESAITRKLDYIYDVQIDPDGKIIAAGTGYNGGSNSILVRLNANGTFDNSFGANGLAATIHFPATPPRIRRQADGKYIIGQSNEDNNVDFLAARYNNDGTRDTSFGPNGQGFITTGFNAGQDAAYAMLLQPDGKIVLAGSAFAAGSEGNYNYFALARYNVGSVVVRRPQFDFDGDGKADLGVFRPSNGGWYLYNLANNMNQSYAFGQAGDVITPADYDGDGRTDVAVFRNGTWYLNRSSAGFTGVGFGAASDIPAPADFDGDGKAELCIFRPSNGGWYTYNLATNQTSGVAFGQAGDRPVAADYDGDGKADFAVYRAGVWYLLRSQLGFTSVTFGDGNDKAVPADYDGDGKADVAVFRPSNGTWYLQRSQLGFTGVSFGQSGDQPAPADYDGDGKADTAVFRAGNWYLNRSTAGFTGVAFGAATDLPTPNAFVR